MKKVTIIALAIISATLFFASCKKKHTCNCDVTSKEEVVSHMSEYDSFEGTSTSSGTSETELDESSKKVAKAACVSAEQNFTDIYYDDIDYDSDGNTSEKAYTVTTNVQVDCSLE